MATQNFLVFANENFFSEILTIINENEKGEIKTTMNDLENAIRVILVCAFYGKSPSLMSSLPTYFPIFDEAIEKCGGVQKFRYIINQLQSPKPVLGISWNNYFKECNAIRRMEKVVSDNCSRVVNDETMRSLTIDDHKFRFVQKNGTRRWGSLGERG
jgi:hypothetical protein